MTIAVTGTSGGVGSRVLQNLLAEADAASVVALARRPEAVPSPARLEVRRVDYDEPGSLRAALAGVAGLVFISSDGVAEAMHRHHEHVIAAARNAAVQHVVYTSILDVALRPSLRPARLLHGQSVGALIGRAAVPSHGLRLRNP
jgi:NAD(P)H dehydrogenase (quinone)